VLAYFPGVGAYRPEVMQALAQSAVFFFDGTFWSSDELIRLELGTKRAEDMSHWPVGGAEGSLARLGALQGPRRILIHVNNTNPLLREDSPEHAAMRAAGLELAHDGLELTL